MSASPPGVPPRGRVGTEQPGPDVDAVGVEPDAGVAGPDPLAGLVAGLREHVGAGPVVPSFDPAGPGTTARVLVLMQSPGPATVRAGTAAVCSETSPGPTARALRAARAEAGLVREDYLRWNVVPWSLPGSPVPLDLDRVRPWLHRLLLLRPAWRSW